MIATAKTLSVDEDELQAIDLETAVCSPRGSLAASIRLSY